MTDVFFFKLSKLKNSLKLNKSDEKWFLLKRTPNWRSDWRWACISPRGCRLHRGKQTKNISLVALNCHIRFCLNKELPIAYYPQDGASSELTQECIHFLKAKFEEKVMSRTTQLCWPFLHQACLLWLNC